MKDLMLDMEELESVEAPSGWFWGGVATGVVIGGGLIALT